MEYSLTSHIGFLIGVLFSLNPCCNGILPDKTVIPRFALSLESLNPCCNGILPDAS